MAARPEPAAVGHIQPLRGPWLQVVAAGLFIDVSYGTLSYAFSVLITDKAAGGTFGSGDLAAVFGLAVLVSGVAALGAGSIADQLGSRRLLIAGSTLGAVGLALFAACDELWQAALVFTLLLGPAMAATFYEP